MGASKVDPLVQTLPPLSLAELGQLGEAVEWTLKAKQTSKKPKADERPRCPACHAEQPYRWGKSGTTPRSCRKLAKALGVHRMTAWRWRLKVLWAIDGYGDRAPAALARLRPDDCQAASRAVSLANPRPGVARPP